MAQTYATMHALFHPFREFFHKYLLLLLGFGAILLLGVMAKPLGLLAGLAMLALFMHLRQAGHAVLLLALFLILGDNLNPSLAFFKDLRILGIVFLGLVTFVQVSMEGFKIHRSIAYLLPFTLVSVVSLLYSPMLTQAAPRTLSFFLLPFVVFHLFRKELRNTEGLLIRDVVVLAMMILLLGDLLFLIKPSLVSWHEGIDRRVQGIFGNPNGLGIFCTLLFPLVVYLRRHTALLSRPFYLLSMGLLFVNILLSGSRTSLLAASLFFALYWINLRPGAWGTFLKYVAFPGFIALVVLVIFPILSRNPLFAERFRLSTMSNAGGRLDAWVWGYQQVPKALWVGRGLMYDSYMYQTEIPRKVREHHRGWNAAFSGILAILLNNGVLGLLTFCYFMVMLTRRFLVPAVRGPTLLLVLTSAIFESWVVASLNAFMIFFYLMVVAFQELHSDESADT